MYYCFQYGKSPNIWGVDKTRQELGDWLINDGILIDQRAYQLLMHKIVDFEQFKNDFVTNITGYEPTEGEALEAINKAFQLSTTENVYNHMSKSVCDEKCDPDKYPRYMMDNCLKIIEDLCFFSQYNVIRCNVIKYFENKVTVDNNDNNNKMSTETIVMIVCISLLACVIIGVIAYRIIKDRMVTVSEYSSEATEHV